MSAELCFVSISDLKMQKQSLKADNEISHACEDRLQQDQDI